MMDQAMAEELPGCGLCGVAITEQPPRIVNGSTTCVACVGQLERELAAQQAGAGAYPLATAGGLTGALLGGAVWAGIAVAAKFEVGYVAVLVGFLAGFGVKLGARTARGLGLQLLAAGLAVIGLLAAKYMTFAYLLRDLARDSGVTIGWLDGEMISLFPSYLSETASPFDLLWIILAISAAYRVPKAADVSIL